MQAKEIYSDRRRNKIRYDRRRRSTRLNLSFKVSLPDQDGKTINISESGVYFEVITNDMKAFSPGTIIPLQINTVSNMLRCGRGIVIRNCIIENPDHDSSLCVALEFTDKLNFVLDND